MRYGHLRPRLCLVSVLLVGTPSLLLAQADVRPVVGDDASAGAPRLLVLDRGGSIHA